MRPADDRLIWRQWGEAHFVFHPASGQTHFLNELAAFAVRAIACAPKSTAEIYTAMLAAYALDDAPDLREALRDILVNLDHLGLVEGLTGP